MLRVEPGLHTDYELLDFGGGRKLERFGSVVLDRPEVLAAGNTHMDFTKWRETADARFEELKNDQGTWVFTGANPGVWNMRLTEFGLQLQLECSPFKHIGIFPEQYANWLYIREKLRNSKASTILNLFAYTGVASLVSCKSGARVTHVDASKSVVTKARQNMELSGLRDIRWIVDDAVTFVNREIRRGNRYQGIILDPPAFGRSKAGGLWLLEQGLASLLRSVRELLDSNGGWVILNTYSTAMTQEEIGEIVRSVFASAGKITTDWLTIESNDGRQLPMSLVHRITL
ncbi:MAG: 23S rRNA (cytosine1962-C5)-methyltransferase [Bacteroidetes bacterium HLUCCA01]|nr:MAG: 23S rRNA (cytosine1962-C5)-methyltransferase [Bacteroidetes bacterium HLUCCA01]